MKSNANSTIAALCYAKPSKLDFADVAAQLEHALRSSSGADVSVAAKYSDVMILDISGLRICLAFCDLRRDYPDTECFEGYAECLMLSVGSAPVSGPDAPFIARRCDVCQGLVHRINRQHPPDQVIMIEYEDVFNEDTFDNTLETFLPILQAAKLKFDTPVCVFPNPWEERLGDKADPDAILADLTQRYDMARSARQSDQRFEASDQGVLAPTPTPKGDNHSQIRLRGGNKAEARVVTSARALQRSALRPQQRIGVSQTSSRGKTSPAELNDLRFALYHDAETSPEPRHEKPLVHRAAIHSMNAAMLAFSLPFGAAMLTMSLLGRESMVISSRAMGLTGSSMGLSQTETGAQLIGMFI